MRYLIEIDTNATQQEVVTALAGLIHGTLYIVAGDGSSPRRPEPTGPVRSARPAQRSSALRYKTDGAIDIEATLAAHNFTLERLLAREWPNASWQSRTKRAVAKRKVAPDDAPKATPLAKLPLP